MNFFRINIRKNSWRIAQKILSKKVKQVLKRRGGGTGVAMELQKNPKVNRYENSTVDASMIF